MSEPDVVALLKRMADPGVVGSVADDPEMVEVLQRARDEIMALRARLDLAQHVSVPAVRAEALEEAASIVSRAYGPDNKYVAAIRALKDKRDANN